jgi:hypothetical protein
MRKSETHSFGSGFESVTGACEHGDELLASIKGQGTYCAVQQLYASQMELSFIELVIHVHGCETESTIGKETLMVNMWEWPRHS